MNNNHWTGKIVRGFEHLSCRTVVIEGDAAWPYFAQTHVYFDVMEGPWPGTILWPWRYGNEIPFGFTIVDQIPHTGELVLAYEHVASSMRLVITSWKTWMWLKAMTHQQREVFVWWWALRPWRHS